MRISVLLILPPGSIRLTAAWTGARPIPGGNARTYSDLSGERQERARKRHGDAMELSLKRHLPLGL